MCLCGNRVLWEMSGFGTDGDGALRALNSRNVASDAQLVGAWVCAIGGGDDCKGDVCYNFEYASKKPGSAATTFDQLKARHHKDKKVKYSISCDSGHMVVDSAEGFQKHCYFAQYVH